MKARKRETTATYLNKYYRSPISIIAIFQYFSSNSQNCPTLQELFTPFAGVVLEIAHLEQAGHAYQTFLLCDATPTETGGAIVPIQCSTTCSGTVESGKNLLKRRIRNQKPHCSATFTNHTRKRGQTTKVEPYNTP